LLATGQALLGGPNVVGVHADDELVGHGLELVEHAPALFVGRIDARLDELATNSAPDDLLLDELEGLCRVPDEAFDFLGYTIGRCYSPRTGRAYIGTRPSGKKIQSLCLEIREHTSRRWTFLDPAVLVARQNRTLVGWANYFCLGPGRAAYRLVDTYVCHRLRQWLGRKNHVQGGTGGRINNARVIAGC
jgi:hypothetical protein